MMKVHICAFNADEYKQNLARTKCIPARFVRNTFGPNLKTVGKKVSKPKTNPQNEISKGWILDDRFRTNTHMMLSNAENAAA